MKKIIFLICLFVASVSFAEDWRDIDFKQKPKSELYALVVGFSYSGSAADSCTGTLVISWHMESLDLSSEDGCSAYTDQVWAATVATLTDTDKSEGTYSGYATTGDDYHQLDIDSTVPKDEGTIWLDIRIGAWTSAVNILNMRYDGDEEISIRLTGAATTIDITGIYEHRTSQYLQVSANTNINPADDDWYRIKYQWKTDETDADHQIDVWLLDSNTPRGIDTGPTTGGPEDTIDDTQMTDPIRIRIGVVDSATTTLYWDNFKLYNTSDL